MPPVVIAGGIAAAGAIGGAVLSSSAQKKAASQAAGAQQDATQAELQLGRESMALNQDIYNRNTALLNPFVQRGNVAGDSINALLGLPAPPATPQPTTGGQTNPVVSRLPLVSGGFRGEGGRMATEMRDRPNPGVQTVGQPATPQTSSQSPAVNALSAQDAFNNFANSAGMQFQLHQGEDAINNGYAARGQLQSGAAMKALQDYGQQTALQNYFMPYMGLLGGQQATGAGAASAVAGVGTNFGNTAANINAGMGANIQNGANALSNAALLRGQANANMYSGIGGALGGFASSFFPTGGH